MRYIRVENMARYYLIAKLIQECNYPKQYLIKACGINSYNGFERFLNLYLIDEEPELCQDVKRIMKEHAKSAKPIKLKGPGEHFKEFISQSLFKENENNILLSVC